MHFVVKAGTKYLYLCIAESDNNKKKNKSVWWGHNKTNC